MRSNVIMLTAGLAGSSVTTGLLAKAGDYWTGEETFKKKDYDTYENIELVQLNKRIFEQAAYDGHYETEFAAWPIEHILRAAESFDPAPFEDFVRRCNEHSPWIWKDPRLWLTVRVWAKWLPMERTRFVLITRDPMQNWISLTVRRQIQTFEHAKWYLRRVDDTLRDFVRVYGAQAMEVEYESLIRRPERELARLSEFLEVDVTLEHLREIYRGELYQAPKSWRDRLKAYAIYAKNYHQRLRA